jgi:RNA polymerase sigma-70 factor, ECF subfamily
MDEASLIRAAQQGDQDAFASLVQSYDQNVLRIAMNLLRSPEEAKDVYQEAFLRVYRNLHSFRFDCSFPTWLYRIVLRRRIQCPGGGGGATRRQQPPAAPAHR